MKKGTEMDVNPDEDASSIFKLYTPQTSSKEDGNTNKAKVQVSSTKIPKCFVKLIKNNVFARN